MYFDFFIRIIVCFFLSIIIGLERQYRHKMVGLRTNVLVSLGAFMFNWVTCASVNSDNTRIAAQVVSGIGFLGAGIIMRDGINIKGLNTAATLWCVAAIGLMSSVGLLVEACVGTLMVLISNVVLRFLSIIIMNKLKNNEKELCVLRIKCSKNNEYLLREEIYNFFDKNSLKLFCLNKSLKKQMAELKIIIITSRINIIENYINKMMLNPLIYELHLEHEKYIDKNVVVDEDE